MLQLMMLASLGIVWLNRSGPLLVPSIINAVACVWSCGVMLNFRNDPENAPNWAATVSIITAVAIVGLFIAHWFVH